MLRHEENRGKGAALKTGFESLNGDSIIVTIDIDGKTLVLYSILNLIMDDTDSIKLE